MLGGLGENGRNSSACRPFPAFVALGYGVSRRQGFRWSFRMPDPHLSRYLRPTCFLTQSIGIKPDKRLFLSLQAAKKKEAASTLCVSALKARRMTNAEAQRRAEFTESSCRRGLSSLRFCVSAFLSCVSPHSRVGTKTGCSRPPRSVCVLRGCLPCSIRCFADAGQ